MQLVGKLSNSLENKGDHLLQKLSENFHAGLSNFTNFKHTQ